jgi:hypothetical protein
MFDPAAPDNVKSSTTDPHEAPITHQLWKSKMDEPIHQHEASVRSDGTYRGLLGRDYPGQCCDHVMGGSLRVAA